MLLTGVSVTTTAAATAICNPIATSYKNKPVSRGGTNIIYLQYLQHLKQLLHIHVATTATITYSVKIRRSAKTNKGNNNNCCLNNNYCYLINTAATSVINNCYLNNDRLSLNQ
jgi:hypothetical protein